LGREAEGALHLRGRRASSRVLGRTDPPAFRARGIRARSLARAARALAPRPDHGPVPVLLQLRAESLPRLFGLQPAAAALRSPMARSGPAPGRPRGARAAGPPCPDR